MVSASLPYGRQWIDEEDVAAVVSTLRGEWLTQGPTIARFEEAIAERVGSKYCVAVASGTAALHLACLAAGVRSGDWGLTSTITFVASANAIRYAGGRPSLLDVDEETGLVSAEHVSSRVRELAASGTRPKVVIPVDLAGAVVDLPAIRAIADRAGALVIEDAAHSLGATYDAAGATYRAAGAAHAHAAILSFHPVKHITTGEGGAVTTNDESLYRELQELRTHGITRDPARMQHADGPWYYEQRTLGFNYRITDLQCALGLSQLAKLERFVERRRVLAARYDQALAGFQEDVRPLRPRAGCRSSYHLYVVRLRPRSGESLGDVARRRLAAFVHLRERGLGVQVHYIPVHRQPDYVANGFSRDDLTSAERYYASCISLPLFPAMTEGDVDRAVDALSAAVSGAR